MTSTEPTSTESPKLLRELQTIVSACNPPHNEAPSVIRRRRIIVAIVLLIGAAVLGYSLSLQPGDSAFYGATMALAGVWAIGAFVSGPLHLGCVRFRGRNQRPIVTGVGIGALLGGVFIVGGLIVREIGPVAEYIRSVLEYAQQGSLPLIVAITVINGLAEELYFRGALYSALGRFHPTVISTVLYTIAIIASQNPMLVFAAIILGTVCAWERRFTNGVLAPILTHMTWGLIMVLVLPPLFGL